MSESQGWCSYIQRILASIDYTSNHQRRFCLFSAIGSFTLFFLPRRFYDVTKMSAYDYFIPSIFFAAMYLSSNRVMNDLLTVVFPMYRA